METNQIDVFAASVFGNLKEVEHPEKSGCLRQGGSNVRETYGLYGVDLDLPLVVHAVAAADFDVRAQPEPNAAGDFPAADSVP
jgi:hypothetical protein